MPHTIAELERLSYIRGESSAHHLALLDDARGNIDSVYAARAHIQDARSGYPSEDCLQSIIQHVQDLAQSRVTKADMVTLVGLLEELQTSIGHATGYGLDELNKAEQSLVSVEG